MTKDNKPFSRVEWVDYRQSYSIDGDDTQVEFDENGVMTIDTTGGELGQARLTPLEAMSLASLIITWYAEHIRIEK